MRLGLPVHVVQQGWVGHPHRHVIQQWSSVQPGWPVFMWPAGCAALCWCGIWGMPIGHEDPGHLSVGQPCPRSSLHEKGFPRRLQYETGCGYRSRMMPMKACLSEPVSLRMQNIVV